MVTHRPNRTILLAQQIGPGLQFDHVRSNKDVLVVEDGRHSFDVLRRGTALVQQLENVDHRQIEVGEEAAADKGGGIGAQQSGQELESKIIILLL